MADTPEQRLAALLRVLTPAPDTWVAAARSVGAPPGPVAPERSPQRREAAVRAQRDG